MPQNIVSRGVFGAVIAAAAVSTSVVPAMAAWTTTADPGVTWDLNARARNARTGFELAFQDPAVVNLNAPGAPAWSYGNAHHFELSFNGLTNTLSYSMDFNRNNAFGPGETLTHTFPSNPGDVRDVRYFDLFLQGNGIGEAKVDNLTINGTGFGTFGFTANNVVEQVFTDSAGGVVQLLVSGDMTFSANGNSDERPRMWLRMDIAVPEPATVAVLGFGLAALAGSRRRRPSAGRNGSLPPAV